MSPREYAKAIVAALVAGLTAVGTALADAQVTAAEWVGVALGVVVAGGAVFSTSNADPDDPQENRPDALL